jgi:hypothetical protein
MFVHPDLIWSQAKYRQQELIAQADHDDPEASLAWANRALTLAGELDLPTVRLGALVEKGSVLANQPATAKQGRALLTGLVDEAEKLGEWVVGQGRISTYPPVPCTRIRCPSRISRVACCTPTTAGRPYSRAITAPWVIRPPTSVTRPVIPTNRGDQLGSV